jgi:hypothetical protein
MVSWTWTSEPRQLRLLPLRLLSVLVALVLVAGGARGVVGAFTCVSSPTRGLDVPSGGVATIFFAQLPCADGPSTYYIGNYTVQSAERFTLRYGDQDCQDADYDDRRYDYASVAVTDYLTETAQFGFYPAYPSYRTKMQIECNQVIGLQPCTIKYTVCMGIYPRTALDGR